MLATSGFYVVYYLLKYWMAALSRGLFVSLVLSLVLQKVAASLINKVATLTNDMENMFGLSSSICALAKQ